MVQVLQENPFRKPEERLEFFRKLIQQNPTKKWVADIAKNSPASNPAGVVSEKALGRTIQQEEANDAEAQKGKAK